MIYISIYLGIFCGYILRFFKTFERIFQRNNKKQSATSHHTLQYTLHCAGHFISVISKGIFRGILLICFTVRNRVLTLLSIVKTGIIRLKQFLSHARHFTLHWIQHCCLSVKRWWQLQKSQLLSHSFIYIWAKVTDVYSESGNKVKLLSYSNIKQYCLKHNEKYIVLEPPQDRPVCIPAFFERSEEKIVSFTSPEVYLAQLHNVTISGQSSIILSENECLYDPFISDTDKRLDIKFSNVIGNINGQILVETAPTCKTISEGIFLMGFASSNYYHLCVEIMSRLKYVDSFEEYHKLPIIVDKIMLKVPQYCEILKAFNRCKHPIIEIGKSDTFKVEKLIYPSYNTWMPINVKKREMIRPSDFLLAQSGLENIRSYIKFASVKQDRKIFISRKNTAAARLGNENAIASLFQKYGFEIIHTENLTYMEQVALFHSAQCVAGASGAALTNIIYCQPDTEIICIIPREYEFYMYSTIAYMLNLKSVYLDARVTQKTAYTASDIFELDENYCERFLKQYTALQLTYNLPIHH